MSSLKIAFNWTCSRILHYGNRNNNNDDDDDDDDDDDIYIIFFKAEKRE